MPQEQDDPRDDETPPFLGRWSRIYAVVIVWTLVCMAAIGAFARWASSP
jgi:hypothetical protein